MSSADFSQHDKGLTPGLLQKIRYHMFIARTTIKVLGGNNLYCSFLWDSDIQACANNVDPDQTPQNAASDQGLHSWPLIRQFLDISTHNKIIYMHLVFLKYNRCSVEFTSL